MKKLFKFNKLEVVLFLLFLIMVGCIFVKSNIEGFSEIPLRYDTINENDEFYEPKKDPSLNPRNIGDVMRDNDYDRRVAMYDQKTNNQRQHKQPDNGSCTPSDICNNMYKNKDIEIKVEASPPDLFYGNRVNYYFHNPKDSL